MRSKVYCHTEIHVANTNTLEPDHAAREFRQGVRHGKADSSLSQAGMWRRSPVNERIPQTSSRRNRLQEPLAILSRTSPVRDSLTYSLTTQALGISIPGTRHLTT
ncbi:uncharacterized protein EKO05_0011110 [Ascochyta rabiei]|uniref:uncharacterized protein n=1 Tax=Didymella rabiei TaxID=5454 RepID=UPI002204141B|nr:uncharacterized protein EKO05_0011110 [Ascochyta rabiei]UPX20897.1 hypothetical protein EKO05_0011110 [Ascochyta rabiei]